METLDPTDLKILKIIQEDSSLTIKEIAMKVNLSTTPVFERIRRLESQGYIKKYIAILDPEKLNLGFTVYCNVKLRKLSHDNSEDFVNTIQKIPEVTECYNTTGQFDYLLKIRAPNMRYYHEFITNVLGRIESIGSIESSFVMAEIKYSHSLIF